MHILYSAVFIIVFLFTNSNLKVKSTLIIFQVSWYRRQKKLHETDRQIFQRKSGRNTLHIRNLNPTDFGNYSCRASNQLGKARTYTSLAGNLQDFFWGGRETKVVSLKPYKQGSNNYDFQATLGPHGLSATRLDTGRQLTTSHGRPTATLPSQSTSCSTGSRT